MPERRNKVFGKVFQPLRRGVTGVLTGARKLFHRFLLLRAPYKIAIITLLVVLTFTGCASLYYSHLSRPEDLFEKDLEFNPDEESSLNDWDVEAYFSQDIVNIVLLGFDRDQKREDVYSIFRTDTIKVVSINFDQEKVSIINIPRDIYTRIADTDIKDKINHSYYYGYRYGEGEDRHAGGLAYTLGSVSNVLGGIPLKYYVGVDMDGVVKLVDAIEGVPFDVPFDVYNTDGRLLIRKGYQILDGEKYLHYLRTRLVGGDVGRVERQTDLLLATLEHVKSKGLFKQLPVLYSHYKQLLDTNLSSKQIISLALYLRNFSADQINIYTLTGFGQSSDGVYYMVIDQEKRAEIVKEVFGLEIPVKEQEILRDTVPKEPKNFSCDIITIETGKLGARLSWQPGDKYNRLYRLYRVSGEEESLITETEDTVYVDFDIRAGATYRYRLEAVNRRETSPAVTLKVFIDPALDPSQGNGGSGNGGSEQGEDENDPGEENPGGEPGDEEPGGEDPGDEGPGEEPGDEGPGDEDPGDENPGDGNQVGVSGTPRGRAVPGEHEGKGKDKKN